MLPYSTLTRKDRPISKGKQDGRNIEIQRLIGRSLRAVLDLKKFPIKRCGSTAMYFVPMAVPGQHLLLEPGLPLALRLMVY